LSAAPGAGVIALPAQSPIVAARPGLHRLADAGVWSGLITAGYDEAVMIASLHMKEQAVEKNKQSIRQGVLDRHCAPTGRANARPMTGSANQSKVWIRQFWIASSLRSSQ
jgi:hypothetical protein